MGQLSLGLTYCLSSFLGIYFQIKPAGFRKVVQCWVLPWPGTGVIVIDRSSLSCICLDKKSPFPITDVFNFSRYPVFISIRGCPAGALWTLHHSYSHDALTFLLETKMHAYAAREWKLTDCTDLGRSSCSSLLTGAGTGCISVSAEPITAFLSLHWCFFSGCLFLSPFLWQVCKARKLLFSVPSQWCRQGLEQMQTHCNNISARALQVELPTARAQIMFNVWHSHLLTY